MVTTRSADKRGAMEGKVEDLALRSRATDIESISQLQSSPTPSKSIRKRTTITVDIPIASLDKKLDPAENTEDDASYATAKDVLSSARDIDSQFAAAAQSFDSFGTATKIEIPDSQETPKKDVLASSQEFVSLNDNTTASTPVSARTRGTKRKLDFQSTPTIQSGEDLDVTPKPSHQSQHRRFGSEDLDDPDTVVVPTGSIQNTQDQAVEDSDDDEAPEVASIKQNTTPKSSTQRNKRRKPAQPIESEVEPTKVPLAPTPTISAHSAESDTTIQPQEGIPITVDRSFSDTTTITPTPTVPDIPSAIEIHSVQKLPLRTTMLDFHPSSTSNRTTNSNSMLSSSSSTSLNSPTNTNNTIEPLSSTLQTLRINRTKPSQPKQSTVLPPKASSTIESYRRNKMMSRKRGKKFETDWSSKRSRFVVA